MKRGPQAVPVETRFWSRVEKKENGCWLYGGERFGNKYGQFSLGPGLGTKSAHRFSYELHHGKIGIGLFVCHKCDVRNCVAPDHLYAGTHEDNTQDKVDRNRNVAPLVGRRMNRIGSYKNQRSLHSTDRQRLMDEYATGSFTQAQLGKRWGMTQSAVSATIRNWPGRKEDGGKKRSGNFRRKLQPPQYQEIRDLYATGLHTQHVLAARFNCDQTTISAIVTHKLQE
jgi:DNA-binding MarR family transcriptional regulator